MRLVFMGTPKFAVPTLRALVKSGHDVVLVVSQPDRPVGRGLKARPTPVKLAAQELSLPVVQPERLSDEEFQAGIKKIAPDAIVVAAYGKMLPRWLLELPKHGCLNVHGSILPYYRGAAPIQRALMDGVSETGVSIMRMDEGMDTGDVFLVKKVAVSPEDTTGELLPKLAEAGAEGMVEVLDGIEKGTARAEIQDDAKATYAPKIEKSETELDWTSCSIDIVNLIRALSPSPGAHTSLAGRRVKVLRARPVDPRTYARESSTAPGSVIALDEQGPVVLCGEGAVVLTQVQPEGKRPMGGGEYVRGRYVKVGGRYGHD